MVELTTFSDCMFNNEKEFKDFMHKKFNIATIKIDLSSQDFINKHINCFNAHIAANKFDDEICACRNCSMKFYLPFNSYYFTCLAKSLQTITFLNATSNMEKSVVNQNTSLLPQSNYSLIKTKEEVLLTTKLPTLSTVTEFNLIQFDNSSIL